MPGGLSFTVEQEDLRRVAKAIRAEEDGKQLRKELIAEIKEVLTPPLGEVRAAVLSMETGGLPHEGEPLRTAIANQTIIEVRTGGKATGASIKAKRKGMPRGFANAPKWTNRTKWRHPVYGRDVYVDQVGKPRWFDETIREHRQEFRSKVARVIQSMARRIASRRP